MCVVKGLKSAIQIHALSLFKETCSCHCGHATACSPIVVSLKPVLDVAVLISSGERLCCAGVKTVTRLCCAGVTQQSPDCVVQVSKQSPDCAVQVSHKSHQTVLCRCRTTVTRLCCAGVTTVTRLCYAGVTSHLTAVQVSHKSPDLCRCHTTVTRLYCAGVTQVTRLYCAGVAQQSPDYRHGNSLQIFSSLHRLIGLVVRVSASRSDDPKFESHLRWDFSGRSQTSDLKLGTPVATLPGA